MGALLTFRHLRLRQISWVLAISGISIPAILLPITAWLMRNDDSSFNKSVGWANILALAVGAIGLALIMAERLGAISSLSRERVAEIVDELAREAMRQDGLLLAQLLSTDALDGRAAKGSFRASRPLTQRRTNAKSSKSPLREFAEIVDYYSSEARGRLVILGSPGAGKTVLMVSLTVGLLKKRAAAPVEERQAFPVPCLFNLPSWDLENSSLEEWLEAQVSERFRVSRKVSARLVRDDLISPILDGLDEMDMEGSDRRAGTAVARINDYIARTPSCQIVVACRSGSAYYERLVRRVRDAEEITVQNLKPAQIVEYVQSQLGHHPSLEAWQSVFDAFEGRNRRLVLSVLETPWRLNAAVTFSLSGEDPVRLLPTINELSGASGSGVYKRRVGELLMETWILSRIMVHGREESAMKIFARLRLIADLLSTADSGTGGGKEIVLHRWWKVFGERKVLGAHMLATWFALHIPMAMLGLFGSPSSVERPLGWITSAAILTNYFTIMGIATRLAARKKGPTGLRIGSLRSPRRAFVAVFGVLTSAIYGLLAGYTLGSLYGFGMGATSAVLLILIAASAGLDRADAPRPSSTITGDRNFAIAIGVVLSAFAMLYYAPLYGLLVGGLFAAMFVLGSICSSFYMRYLVAVQYGAMRGLPIRFYNFLRWCHSAGLMRTSGSGYQFRQQELLDYLKHR